MVILDTPDAPRCTCGRPGCLESLASATALIRMTKEAMAAHPESALHGIAAQSGGVNGRTAFDAAAQGDAAGRAVVEQYIHYLAVGVANMINIFFPEVIGLSGGMDSTLVAVMAADALGADHVHGVMLPGPYSSESSIDDAEALALALGISNITVPICEPFEAFEAVLARACGGALTGLAAENTQARCRMVCLMALSNAHGWLMLNTGNKSEAAMGYSTLYGDTAGAFAPLGGVYKTDVFAMARWRNRRAVEEGGTGPIPVNVFVKPPSAELAPDQEDEKSLGVDYATLDRILVAYVEEGKDAAAIVAESGLSRDLVDYVIARTDANAFKRALEPPYPDAPFYGDPASR